MSVETLKTNNSEALSIMETIGQAAKDAATTLAQIPTTQINTCLLELADAIIAAESDILSENEKDIAAAKKKDLTPALIDRLTLNSERLKAIAQSVRDIAALDDPVGKTLESATRPNGLVIEKTSVPIGVLGMIYESRPNVTIDAAALCLKSRNVVILRGGSESFHSSHALHHIVQQTLERHDIAATAVSMIPDTDRAYVGAMLGASAFIDVMIPRGGKGLTSRVMREATMPVFAHLDGNCHLYIHHSVKPELAIDVVQNAKLRRTGICGAAESLLLNEDLNRDVAKDIITTLLDQNCIVTGDDETQKIDKRVIKAEESDWSTEYLDKKISCKFIASTEEAITHINRYGSHHTDAILAEDANTVQMFLNRVDSAIVMHNTSTQFADGGEFGMGAEIGIGTGKLHARGPVGLKQLTTFKYIVRGNGQTRS